MSGFAIGCIALGSFGLGLIVGAIGITAMAGASLRELRDIFLGDQGH
jgi:hypothetical protein